MRASANQTQTDQVANPDRPRPTDREPRQTQTDRPKGPVWVGRSVSHTERSLATHKKQYWWWCYLWYCLTMIASKISIGYFLLRITVRKIDVWIIYGVMMITVCTGIVFFFVTLFQCNPISFFWNRDQPGKCVDVEVIIALTYLYSVFSVISDFTCAILPIFLVWKLNMGRKTKLALIPVMAMACVLVLPPQYNVRQLTRYRHLSKTSKTQTSFVSLASNANQLSNAITALKLMTTRKRTRPPPL